MYEKWILALDKYEKYRGSLVPSRYNLETNTRELSKKNCACALGVYLIEIKGISAEEIAREKFGGQQRFYDIVNADLGKDFVNEVWRINDKNQDNTFAKVKELICSKM